MKCEMIENRLLEYLRQELDHAVTLEVEAHLATCGHCRAFCEKIEAPLRALGTFPEQEPSPQLRERFDMLLAGGKELPPATAKEGKQADAAGNFFSRLWPSRPVWALCYSLILLFSGVTTGQVLPRDTLPFVQALTGGGESNGAFTAIPEDNLVQWCAVRSQQYREVL